MMSVQLPEAVPKVVDNALGTRAIGFFATTEDGSSIDNRVISGGGATRPVLDYDLQRIEPARHEHHALIRAFVVQLARAGLAGVERYAGLAGTAHAIGSLVTGDDPETSVVDPRGKVHGMANLYVGDGSVLRPHQPRQPVLDHLCLGLAPG